MPLSMPAVADFGWVSLGFVQEMDPPMHPTRERGSWATLRMDPPL